MNFFGSMAFKHFKIAIEEIGLGTKMIQNGKDSSM